MGHSGKIAKPQIREFLAADVAQGQVRVCVPRVMDSCVRVCSCVCVPLWSVRVCSCVCVPLFYVKDSSVRVRACVVCEGQ